MINSKNYLLIIIPYLTLCCGIYQLCYWSLFNINAFNLISLENIVKSSILPLVSTFIASSVGFYLASKTFPSIDKITTQSTEESSTQNGSWLPILLLVLGSLALFILIYYSPGSYYTYAMFAGMITYVLININFIFEKDFNPKLDKRFLLLIMIYFPFISIGKALEDGDMIIKNKSYQFTTKQSPINFHKLDTLKLIGITGDRFIFTNLNNDKLYFLKSDTLQLSQK